jgi:acyl-CoA reductase-like NAD-dependent aldehyde dehydrogenase
MPDTRPSITDALAAQRAFFAGGRPREVEFRLRALRRLREVFVRHEEDIYQALEQDLGKPRFEALVSEFGGVRNELDVVIRRLPGWARPKRRPTPWVLLPGRAFVQPEPYGTVLIISPWNYPFDLSLTPLIGAVAAGNAVIIKPSELAPASSRLLAQIVSEAFPPEHVLVCEGGVEVAQALLAQRFDYIFFTGGEAVGKLVMQAASAHLTPITLELGGKSPAIVDADAPLELAARRILFGKFFNAGQTCIAPDYVLVDQRVYAPFLEQLQAEHRRMYGAHPCRDVGRVINARHFARLVAYLKDGRILCGGEHDAAALRIHPTVLVDVQPDAPVMREEIFGPILPVLPIADFDTAIRFVNDRPRALALYLFSRDRRRHEEVLQRTSSGGVTLNDTLIHYANRDLPFGGIGPSGMGRYHRRASFDTFSHYRSVQVAGTFPNMPLKYPPYKGKIGLLRQVLRFLN